MHCAARQTRRLAFTFCLYLGLSACGGGSTTTPEYSISGSVTGLVSGQTVTVLDNGGDALTLSASGTFTFPTNVAAGGGYAVSVQTEPTGQTCAVTNASGSMLSAAVSNVAVVCSTQTFTIAGTLSGLNGGDQVTLLDNGGNPLTLTANGAFTFTSALAYDDSYNVTVQSQPTGQTCTVSQASGAAITSNVTSLDVTCSTDAYSIGGTLSGLTNSTSVSLTNNAGDPITLSANGAYQFSLPVAYGSSYAVAVSAQPTGQTCSVSNPSGSGVTSNVGNVNVVCSTNTYPIGVTLSGLSGNQIVLLDNNSDALTLTANGAATFSTPLPDGSSYDITVGTQPTTQYCSVTGATGTVSGAVSGPVVICVSNEIVLNSFAGPNGDMGAAVATGALPPNEVPKGQLIMDGSGNLYGTTTGGGSGNGGVVYELSPDGSGGYNETVLHNFSGTDGFQPAAGLIMDGSGNLYGTTTSGGSGNGGIVYELSPDGSGGYTETVLHNFSGTDGFRPVAGLIMDGSGNLYGTTTGGGSGNGGVVYELSPDGSGGYNETVLHNFSGADGDQPAAGLIMDGSGNLYGTTTGGGSGNGGVVYEIHR